MITRSKSKGLEASAPRFFPRISKNKNINNRLNDDCMVNIFQHLSLPDRIKLELVCKRWKCLSMLSWNDMHCFKLDEESLCEIDFCSSVKEKIDFLMKCFKRSVKYLDTVIINYFAILRYDYINSVSILNKIIQEIIKSCQNIQNLTLIRCSNKLSDNNLRRLFSRNLALKSIHLESLILEGHCFLKLNPNFLKKLTILYSDIEDLDYFYDFLAKVRNLNILEIHDAEVINSFDPVEISQALLDSKCENVTELILELTLKREGIEEILSKLLCKQKNLRLLKIPGMQATEAIMESLPESLEKLLNFMFYDDFYCINRLKNLTEFSCQVDVLTDKCALSISECLNLECIDIHVRSTYSLTSFGEAYFSGFQNLTKFKLYLEKEFPEDGPCIDNLLKAVCQCENIKEINTRSCTLSEVGLLHLSLLPNLEILNIPGVHTFTDQDLIYLVRKSLKLKELDINYHENFTREPTRLLFKMNELKSKRGDSHILHIYSQFLEYQRELINFQVGPFLSQLSLIVFSGSRD